MLTADLPVTHSEKQGYPYILQQPNVQKFVPKTYAKYALLPIASFCFPARTTRPPGDCC